MKVFLGKILGEIYRIQNNTEGFSCFAEPSQIFGLLNGFETVIDEEIKSVGFISSEKLKAVTKILDEYWDDQKKEADFKGFFDIEPKLLESGIKRGEASQILKYLKAEGLYITLIDKMDSTNSPSECRTFDLGELDY